MEAGPGQATPLICCGLLALPQQAALLL